MDTKQEASFDKFQKDIFDLIVENRKQESTTEVETIKTTVLEEMARLSQKTEKAVQHLFIELVDHSDEEIETDEYTFNNGWITFKLKGELVLIVSERLVVRIKPQE